ncbi:MAG: tetratricopeptide repeat protein [Syntrophales bacterium]|jgi:tetratricopeptide (TPR) repeat protein
MTEERKADYIRSLADEFMKAKRYDDAILLYKKLVEMHPGEDSFLLLLAWAYHDSGRLDDAIVCFERLLSVELERKVFTGFAFDELVRIFKERGDYERLLDICERAAAAQPDDIALLNDLGDAYLKVGKAGESVRVFRKMAEMEPDASATYCRLGDALVQAGDLDDAEAAYRRAVEIDPSEAGNFYNRLANVYCNEGHDEKAESAFRKCIEFGFDNPMYHCGLGDVLVKRGKIDDAQRVYEEVVDLHRASAGAYYNRFGNTLARGKHHGQAIEAFKKAIAADPRNPFYYVHLADSYAALGLSDAAEETYRQAESLR